MADEKSSKEALLRDVKADVSNTFNQVKSEVDELVDSLDLGGALRHLQNFGRERPIVLALTALTLGVAAGLLIKSPEEHLH